MANGIYVYAEVFDHKVEEYTSELIKAAKSLKLDTPITVLAFGNDEMIEQLQWKNVSALVIADNERHEFDDGERAKILADVFREKDPMIILLPATTTAKSLFSRVAVLLDAGMTADATEIFVERGIFKQKKPAFGDNAMVVTEEIGFPAIVTIVPGIYKKEPKGMVRNIELLNRQISDHSVNLLEISDYHSDSISDARRIISLGKGCIDGEAFGFAKTLADKLEAKIGGTRPLVDSGLIPFEAQIGQTGCVVHPESCLFLGVSGAIQHTEGVRDAAVTIAVNNDPDAAIFSYADYGVVADAGEIIQALIKQLE